MKRALFRGQKINANVFVRSFQRTLRVLDVRAENRGRPHRKVRFFCGPGVGEKLFDPGASGRKGQECPREIRTEKFYVCPVFLSLTFVDRGMIAATLLPPPFPIPRGQTGIFRFSCVFLPLRIAAPPQTPKLCDPSRHLQESPDPRARNRKKVSKKVFLGGPQKSLKKYPKKSKNTHFRIFLGIF